MGTFTSVSPTTGNNGTVLSVSGPAYTGRTAVTETYQVKTTSGSPQASVTLSATRQAETLVLTNSSFAAMANTAGTAVLQGTSNASKLTFAWNGTNLFTLSAFQISTDGGSTWTAITSGTAIADDPGARAAYQWRVTITRTANTTISTKSSTLKVSTTDVDNSVTTTPTPAPGKEISITITQNASVPSISLSATSVTLAPSGAAQTVTVTSNASFSVV